MSVFRASSHALITGGASGIGYAVAELCLKNSMKVTIADSNQETLDLAKKNLNGDVHCVKTDVSDAGAWKKLKEQTGDVDFLMLNAGRMVKGTWGDSEYFNQVRSISYTRNAQKRLPRIPQTTIQPSH
jgi:NADP-dependent 3-hydroxy acid dehydrogenase YdfG